MAVNYSTAVKTARLQVASDMIAGKTPAAATGTATAGQLIIQDAASVILANIAVSTTPFTVSGTSMTLNGVPISDTSADATGTASKAEFRNNGGTTVISGLTVGVGTGDIQLTSVSLTAGQTVTITAGTINHG